MLRTLVSAARRWWGAPDGDRAEIVSEVVNAIQVRFNLRWTEVSRDTERTKGAPYLTRVYLLALRERYFIPGMIALAALPVASSHVPLHVLAGMMIVAAFVIGEVTAFVHCFCQDDPDPLHDHPWRWWMRIILTGGYYETTWDGDRWIAPGIRSIEFRFGSRFHRVRLKPEHLGNYRVWTLFIHGPRRYSWGFVYTDAAGVIRRTDESKKLTRSK